MDGRALRLAQPVGADQGDAAGAAGAAQLAQGGAARRDRRRRGGQGGRPRPRTGGGLRLPSTARATWTVASMAEAVALLAEIDPA